MTSTDEQDFADLTDDEQVGLLLGSPNKGQTDNSPDPNIEQPPQDPDWRSEEVAVSIFDVPEELQ